MAQAALGARAARPCAAVLLEGSCVYARAFVEMRAVRESSAAPRAALSERVPRAPPQVLPVLAKYKLTEFKLKDETDPAVIAATWAEVSSSSE